MWQAKMWQVNMWQVKMWQVKMLLETVWRMIDGKCRGGKDRKSSLKNQPYPEDLICAHIARSKKFIEAVHTLQRDMVKGISHFTNRTELSFVHQYAKGGHPSCHGIAAVNNSAGELLVAQEFVAALLTTDLFSS